ITATRTKKPSMDKRLAGMTYALAVRVKNTSDVMDCENCHPRIILGKLGKSSKAVKNEKLYHGQ
ncbi:MAG: hypothetical protein Q7R65_04895, partial [bacterium]|nr:hypothetical protein [bacterium]